LKNLQQNVDSRGKSGFFYKNFDFIGNTGVDRNFDFIAKFHLFNQKLDFGVPDQGDYLLTLIFFIFLTLNIYKTIFLEFFSTNSFKTIFHGKCVKNVRFERSNFNWKFPN